MRIRRQGPDPEIFEQWCEAEVPRPNQPYFDFGSFANQRENETPEQIAENFTTEVMEAVQRPQTPLRVDISDPNEPPPWLAFDFSNSFKQSDLKADTVSHISHLFVSSKTIVRIVGGVIHNLSLHGYQTGIELEGCCIARLVASDKASARIVLRDTWIGHLRLESSSVHHMELNGGSIRDIECPLPDNKNPFTGPASIAVNVDFPTSRRRWRLLQGAQVYTNVRAHLKKLENVPAANLMRSLELRTERHDDHGFTRLVSWFYDMFANYGLSPGRPLLWALTFYLLSAGIIFLSDGSGLGMDSNAYHGWQLALTEGGFWGELRRALVLPLQSIVNPLGLFGVRKLVVAATGWGHMLLSVQGLFTDALLVMAILGIRKRFKLP